MLEINLTPFPVLPTASVLLRQLTPADAPAEFLLRSNPLILKYFDREPFVRIEEAEAFIARIQSALDSNSAITWSISLPDSEKHIGSIGFWRIDKVHHRAEIGYMLHPDYWQKGLMREIMPAVLHYAFSNLGLHSIEANVNLGNMASIRLLEKHGFVREAYYKENYFFRGKFLDSAMYSLLAPK